MKDIAKRFGIKLAGKGIRESIALAQYADDRGVDSIWVAEGRLATDAIVPVSVYAHATRRIRVGPGVIPIWTRNPALIAQTFATLDFLAPGRITLGLGAWWEPLASRVGVDMGKKVVRAVREYVESIRLLLSLEEVTYHGEYVHLDGVSLDHGESEPHDVKIYLAAVGPQMLRLTGRIADGVVLNSAHTTEATRREVEEITKGAESVGRTLDDVDIVQPCTVRLTQNKKEALQLDKPMVAQFVAQQPHVAGPAGIDPDLVQRLRSVITWPSTPEQIREGAQLIPDRVVESLGCYGDEDEVRERLRAFEEAGVNCLFPAASEEIIDFMGAGW